MGLNDLQKPDNAYAKQGQSFFSLPAGSFAPPLSRDLKTGSYIRLRTHRGCVKVGGSRPGGTCPVFSAIGSGLLVVEGIAVEFRSPSARCGWLWPAAVMANWTRSTKPWPWRSGAARDRWMSFCAAATSKRCAMRPTCAAWRCRPSTATCRPSTGKGRSAGPRSPRRAAETASRSGLA